MYRNHLKLHRVPHCAVAVAEGNSDEESESNESEAEDDFDVPVADESPMPVISDFRKVLLGLEEESDE